MSPPKDKEIEPIPDTFDNVVATITNPKSRRTQESKNISSIISNFVDLGAAPAQGELFHVEKQIEYQGIEMGVLENGIPYLSESGLARMCGIHRRPLNTLAVNWSEEKHKPRGRQIAELLEQAGYNESTLFLRSENNGTPVNAYTEPVCLALLEYYAFVAEDTREEAVNAFRTLAKTSFRAFIFGAVGYSPDQKMLDSWKHFHDRLDMTLDSVPVGYFSIFREIASMIVPMIRAGILISDKVVPDISAGKAWSEFWGEHKLVETYGERIRYPHDYPLYYPQAKSNPQPCYAYPDAALGVFRAWLRQQYITNKFPKYLIGQTKTGKLPAQIATKAIEAFTPKQLPKP